MINKIFTIKKSLKIQKSTIFYTFYMFLNITEIDGILLNAFQSIIFSILPYTF